MARNNKKYLKILSAPFKIIYLIFIGIIYTFIISLPKNLKTAKTFAFNKEKRQDINRKVQQEKMIRLLKEKISRLERLVYSIINEGDYLKSDKGKIDIKELKKEVK